MENVRTLKVCQDGIGLNVVTQEWCEIESCSLVGWTGIKQVMYKMERKEIENRNSNLGSWINQWIIYHDSLIIGRR